MSYLMLDLPLAAGGLDAATLAAHAIMLWTLSAAAILWQRTRRTRLG